MMKKILFIKFITVSKIVKKYLICVLIILWDKSMCNINIMLGMGKL